MSERAYKNENSAIWYKSREIGWTLSREIVERASHKSGLSLKEVDYALGHIAKQIKESLLAGKAVGIPGVGVLRVVPAKVNRGHSNVGPRNVRGAVFPMLTARACAPFKKQMRESDTFPRGSVSNQFAEARARVLRKPRTQLRQGKASIKSLTLLRDEDLQ